MSDANPPASAPSHIYAMAFLLVALLLVGAASLAVLGPFLPAIAWAAIVALASGGLHRRLLMRTRRPGLAALLTCVGIALGGLLPASLLILVIVRQAASTATWVAEELKRRQIDSVSDIITFPGVASAVTWVQSHTGLSLPEMQGHLRDFAGNVSTRAAKAGGALVAGSFESVMTFLITIFLVYFFLKDGKVIERALLDLIPLPEAERKETLRGLQAMIRSTFRGSLLCALVMGICGGIGWAFAGLSGAVLAGALMAVASLIPLGGTALIWGPGAILLWMQGRPGAAIFLALWGFVVVSFLADNVLRPFLIKGEGEQNTLVVFLGVFGGIPAFGLLGIFLGPLVLSLLFTLIETLRRIASPRPETAPAEP